MVPLIVPYVCAPVVFTAASAPATRFFAEKLGAIIFPLTIVFPVVSKETAFVIFAPLLKVMMPAVVASDRSMIVGVPLKVVAVAFVIVQFEIV